MRRPLRSTALAAGLLLAAVSVPATTAVAAPASPASPQGDASYLVVLEQGVTSAAAQQLITATGGTVVSDMAAQIGVVVARSSVAGYDAVLRASGLVADAGRNLRFQGIPGGGPQRSADPLEPLQWDMQQIRTEQAHRVQAGSPRVDVGILDSGIDGRHTDFLDARGRSNVDCGRGRDFVLSAGISPLGTPDPCLDNQFHGTHVAGTVAARANGRGIVGVAPNVTLVPVKVCDAEGYCYASSVVEGITYAGDAELDVINMSLFIDDDEFHRSTEFKCSDDPAVSSLRRAAERAIAYARTQGVLPVAALGNSDQDLANPVDDDGNPIPPECEVVPAETEGVVGVTALGPQSEKAGYSNYGRGEADVAAPGGNGSTGDCTTTILSTLPGGYGCIQGTSMASPHAAGVAALVVSQFGRLGRDGDVKMSPDLVARYLRDSTIDIGRRGYDMCFGEGRIDARRAVERISTDVYDRSAPFCPEYTE
jgi:subtilisin family serine protease